jgi:hypothetical protein
LFNGTGIFNKSIKKQAEKATKAMFEVLNRGRTHNLSIECLLAFFSKPYIIYLGVDVFNFNNSLQNLSCTFSRHCIFLLKLHISEPYSNIGF